MEYFMKNVDRIITAKDYSLRYGADGTVRGFILKWRAKLQKERGVTLQVNGLEGDGQGEPVQARIWQGQWIAECDVCNGHEFVAPDEPVFFCFGCGNRENRSYVRPVEFPANWQEIEQVILERPVYDKKGLTDLERAGLAKPAVIVVVDGVEFPITRSWMPGESVEELRQQNLVLVGVELNDKDVVVIQQIAKEQGDGV